jgi:hypothetical protein
MKKTFLAMPKYAVRYTSRRFPSQPFASVAYKEDGGAGDNDDKRTEEELLATIQQRIDTALQTRATKEELKRISDEQKEALKGVSLDALRAMADDKTGAMATLASQGLEIQRLKTQIGKQEVKDLSLRAQIQAWREDNKDAIEAIKNGDKQSLKPLEIRVASPMTPATVNSGNSPFIGRVQVEGGVNDIPRTAQTFWDYLTKGATSAPTYVWVNKTNPLGAAAFIAPGVAKPGTSFELVAETSVAKKIADSAKAATELLQDIEGMETFIEQELKYLVLAKMNTTLMDSVGSSTVPTGIKQLSTAYTLTTIKTTNPNNADCLRAVVAQLRSGNLFGDITLFINSVDSANMDLAKATDSGVYMLPPFTTADGKTVAGARIVEDNNVTVGAIQAGFMRYYRVLIYKNFTVAWGWENDDFTKNLVTAIGEMRIHQFFNSQYTGAFVYDTFENIKTAITE